MSESGSAFDASLLELRRAFDASFAAPLPERAAAPKRVLVLRAGTTRLAVHLANVSAIQRLPRRVALPDAPPELLGLVGVRGRLVAAYRLARLLGSDVDEDPRWLLLGKGDEPLGLALEGFEGQRDVPAGDIYPDPQPGAARPHVRELARLGDGVVGVLDVEALDRAVRDRSHKDGARKEP